MFSTDFIFRQQENLVDNQKCWAGFRPLCNKILLCFLISDVYSYLPFLYSCVSFMGVIMLLICTPLGFARLFTIVGDLVIKPNWARNLDEEYYSAKFEEDNLNTKIANCKLCSNYILLTPISSPEGRILRNGEILAYYEKTRNEVRDKRQNLDKARQTSMWRRVLGKNLVL